MAVLRELVPTFLSQISHNALRTNRKLETLDACIARIAVRARFGPFHLNWPEPVLLGRPERGNGKRPRSSSCKFNFKPKQETETDKSINIYLCIRGLSCKHTQLCYWRLHTHSCRYTFHHTHLKHLQKNEVKLY